MNKKELYMQNKDQAVVEKLCKQYGDDCFDLIFNMLSKIGDSPDREGLSDTPYRVIKSWTELFSGYAMNPKDILGTTFSENMSSYDEIIICKDIQFYSFCEHHMLPFVGKVHIGYIPSAEHPKVVGLSKLARIVDCFAKRLQIQEKMTCDIATAIDENLNPDGIGVVVEAEHFCMKMRGVNKQNSKMVTSSMLGKFKTQSSTRCEFLELIK